MDDRVPGVKEHDGDREPHPHGMDRACSLEEEPPTGLEAFAPEEAPDPLSARLRDLERETDPSRKDDRLGPPHQPRLGASTDIGGPGRIRTRDTRVKSPLL
jgi:hypothetical protein